MGDRYLYRFAREGTLHTDVAANAREECRKIKSVARMAAQVRFCVRPAGWVADWLVWAVRGLVNVSRSGSRRSRLQRGQDGTEDSGLGKTAGTTQAKDEDAAGTRNEDEIKT